MEKNKIFLGNVSYNTTIETLKEIAAQFGEVVDAYKPQGKGFAFIKFATDEQAEAAIAGFNGKEVDGRELTANIARPKEDRPNRPFNGGGDRNRRFDRERSYNN